MERNLAKDQRPKLLFGKISGMKRGDIQSRVELITVEGYPLITIITNDSLGRLGLKVGKPVLPR